MKSNDILNESESADEYEQHRQKMIKKGKTVYNALKKGVIKPSDPEQPHFSYKLSDNFEVFTNNLSVVINVDGVKIKHLNEACKFFSVDYLISRIRNKFHSHFNIVLEFPYTTEDDVEPMNEGRVGDVGMGITDKELRKISTIYKALKTGKYRLDVINGSLYRYELSDDYHAYRGGEKLDLLVVQPIGKVRVFFLGDNGEKNMEMNTDERVTIYNWMKDKIKDRFKQFDINMIFYY